MFYRHNKTFWYQFFNFKHFLKAENSKDSLASSCVEFSIGLSERNSHRRSPFTLGHHLPTVGAESEA